jgi:hypothetical protein
MIESIYGYRVYVNDTLCIETERSQIRFPRSKKSRIRKKWAKNQKNWSQRQVHKAFVVGRDVYLSTATYEVVKATGKLHPDLLLANTKMMKGSNNG